MIFEGFSYISVPEFSGDAASDAQRVLIENGKVKTFEHVRDVAEMNARIGRMFGLDEEKCRAAGYLHDIATYITGSALDHAHRGAEMAKQIVASYEPAMKSKEEYFAFIDKLNLECSAVTYDKDTVTLKYKN